MLLLGVATATVGWHVSTSVVVLLAIVTLFGGGGDVVMKRTVSCRGVEFPRVGMGLLLMLLRGRWCQRRRWRLLLLLRQWMVLRRRHVANFAHHGRRRWLRVVGFGCLVAHHVNWRWSGMAGLLGWWLLGVPRVELTPLVHFVVVVGGVWVFVRIALA